MNKRAYTYTDGAVGTPVQTVPYTYGDSNWKDKLTAYNNSFIAYDAIGNPVGDGTWTYTWAKGRQLQSMSKAGETVSFTYNADGLRVRKVATSTGVTDYTLHGKNVVHLTNGTNSLHFYYDAQNRPAVVEFNWVPYAYVHNLQGDIIAIVDANGNKVVEYKYDAWGKPIAKTGSLASTLGTLNPFRYRGYVYDEEIGLYYLRSRYYPPIFCRFINMDSVLLKGLLSSNLQAYCCNNPVLYSDSNGRNIFEDVWNGLCSFGQLLSDAFSESQRIKMENDQAALEAWKTVGKAIGNAASTAWNWYVDVIMENQRIQMLNAHLQYEGMKAIGSWFCNGFNALCTALLDGFKAQQQADIISIQQQYTAASRITGWTDPWTVLSDTWFVSSAFVGFCEIIGWWVLPKSLNAVILIIDTIIFVGEKAND